MLRKDEYREFAEKVNKRLAWKPFGWEMILFYTVAFLVPPLAALLMVSCLCICYVFAVVYISLVVLSAASIP
jgi:hypothetical protein